MGLIRREFARNDVVPGFEPGLPLAFAHRDITGCHSAIKFGAQGDLAALLGLP